MLETRRLPVWLKAVAVLGVLSAVWNVIGRSFLLASREFDLSALDEHACTAVGIVIDAVWGISSFALFRQREWVRKLNVDSIPVILVCWLINHMNINWILCDGRFSSTPVALLFFVRLALYTPLFLATVRCLTRARIRDLCGDWEPPNQAAPLNGS